MRIFAGAVLAATLGACSSEPEAPSANQVTAEIPTENTTLPAAAEPRNLGQTNEIDEPADAPPAAPIPAALHGRWGLVPADCTSTRGDAKGLLTIDATMLRFYESRGTLIRIVETEPSRIVADFAFSGEGQTWQRRMTLDAQDNGQTLIRGESGGDGAMPGPLRYRKCG